MLLAVAYDVADDRRRVRLHTFLLGLCEPIQESVFECDLDERRSPAKWTDDPQRDVDAERLD